MPKIKSKSQEAILATGLCPWTSLNNFKTNYVCMDSCKRKPEIHIVARKLDTVCKVYTPKCDIYIYLLKCVFSKHSRAKKLVIKRPFVAMRGAFFGPLLAPLYCRWWCAILSSEILCKSHAYLNPTVQLTNTTLPAPARRYEHVKSWSVCSISCPQKLAGHGLTLPALCCCENITMTIPAKFNRVRIIIIIIIIIINKHHHGILVPNIPCCQGSPSACPHEVVPNRPARKRQGKATAPMTLATKIPKPNAPDRSTAPHLGWYNCLVFVCICYICFFVGIFVVDIVCCASFWMEVEKWRSRIFHNAFMHSMWWSVLKLEGNHVCCLPPPPHNNKKSFQTRAWKWWTTSVFQFGFDVFPKCHLLPSWCMMSQQFCHAGSFGYPISPFFVVWLATHRPWNKQQMNQLNSTAWLYITGKRPASSNVRDRTQAQPLHSGTSSASCGWHRPLSKSKVTCTRNFPQYSEYICASISGKAWKGTLATSPFSAFRSGSANGITSYQAGIL